MQNQPPVSIVASRPAENLKHHSHIFVQDGPHSMTAAQHEAQRKKIEACSAEMAASRTYNQFEISLAKAHKLGAFPYLGEVSLVAYADSFAD